MSENKTIIPELTPPEELPHAPEFLKNRKWFGIKIDKDFLDFSKPYKPPRYTLEHNGIPFGNIGDLHIVSGKPGNGKTNLMSQFMAAILCGRSGNTVYREGIPKPVILYVDTEMSEDDTIAVKNRVCTLAKLPYNKPLDQFQILRLRDTETALERWQKTLEAVWEITQKMNSGQVLHLFLDGLLDIVEDYNDQKECQPIIRECMMLATHYNTSMWMVLHENPLVDKLVGTLGSITQRKVSEIFVVKKHKQSDEKLSDRRLDRPQIYFTVKQVKARGRDVEDWDFEVTTERGWGQPVELDNNGRIDDPNEAKRRRLIKKADEAFSKYKWTSAGARRTDLDQHLNRLAYTSNRDKKDLYDIALAEGLIYQSEDRRYHYKSINKELPNDRVESIPFEVSDENDEAPF